jgi:hypothetical protein
MTSDSYFTGEPPEDVNNIIYYVYTFYGFSYLVVFNSCLSTLQFFIDKLPDYHPSFDISFGFDFFLIFALICVVAKGHLISFKVKQNLMNLLNIPLVIALPIVCQYFDNQATRYYCFLAILITIGVLNAFPQGSVYG